MHRSWETEVRICVTNIMCPVNTKVIEEGRGGGAPGAGAGIPPQPIDTMVKQLSTLQPVENPPSEEVRIP